MRADNHQGRHMIHAHRSRTAARPGMRDNEDGKANTMADRERFTFFKSFREALQCLPRDQRLDVYEAIIDYALEGIEPELDGVAEGFFIAFKPNIDSSNNSIASGSKGGSKRASNAASNGASAPDADASSKGACKTSANPPSVNASNPPTNKTPKGATPKKSNQYEKEKEKEKEVESEVENEDGGGEGVSAADAAAPAPDDMPFETPSVAPPEEPKPKSRRFVPPTVDEVREYAEQYRATLRDAPSFDAEYFVDRYAAGGWKVGTSPMKDWRAAVRNWIRRDMKPGTSAQSGTRASPPCESRPNTTPVQFPPGTKLREKYPREQFPDMSDEEYERLLLATQKRHGGEL